MKLNFRFPKKTTSKNETNDTIIRPFMQNARNVDISNKNDKIDPYKDINSPISKTFTIIRRLESKNRHKISQFQFITLLKDLIYMDVKFIYFNEFKNNLHKNSYNIYESKSYTKYENDYIYFLNYCYFYYRKMFENPEILVNKKIISYANNKIIKKQIDTVFDILNQTDPNLESCLSESSGITF